MTTATEERRYRTATGQHKAIGEWFKETFGIDPSRVLRATIVIDATDLT